MGEVIVITSGKGGVGKTTTAANIGTGLAMLTERQLLWIRISDCAIWMWFWVWRTESYTTLWM